MPPDSVVAFPLACFCFVTAIVLICVFRPLCSFYKDWMYEHSWRLSKKRGFGQTMSKAFGVLGFPVLSPAVHAAWGGVFIGVLFFIAWLLTRTAGVVADAGSDSSIVRLLWVAFLSYFFFFSQLAPEAATGAHVTVLIPMVLLFSALTPSWSVVEDRHLLSESTIKSADSLVIWAVRIALTTAYLGAGISKILSKAPYDPSKLEDFADKDLLEESLLSKERESGSVDIPCASKSPRWIDGATMQGCIFEATYRYNPDDQNRSEGHRSFLMPTPFSHVAQLWCLHYPIVLQILSIGGVAFESLSPIILLNGNLFYSGTLDVLFVIVGVGFHYGIAELQNVDFVSWWGPTYFFFLCGAPHTNVFEALFAALEIAPLPTFLIVIYLVLHICMIIAGRIPSWRSFLQHSLGFDKEFLPLSTFNMFSDTKDLFHPLATKWVWLTKKEHAAGTLKNYSFPFCQREHIREDELTNLPFKYWACGYIPKIERVQKVASTTEVTSMVYRITYSYEVKVFSNLEQDAKMEANMQTLIKTHFQKGPESWKSKAAVDELLGTWRTLQGAFESCPQRRKSPENVVDDKRTFVKLPDDLTPDVRERLEAALKGPTLIFDGVCNLCNGAMGWYFPKIAAGEKVKFMWAQHEDTQILLDVLDVQGIMDSWAYIENSEACRASTAWMRATRFLTWPWKSFHYLEFVIPECMRDLVYHFIAKNRYKLFGKSDVCQRPPKGLREALLHDAGGAKKHEPSNETKKME